MSCGCEYLIRQGWLFNTRSSVPIKRCEKHQKEVTKKFVKKHMKSLIQIAKQGAK